MATRTAACGCGRVTAVCEGEPVRVSVCHCLACQRRSGSAFAAQARFAADGVTISGETHTYVRVADSGNRASFRFCPNCGATIAYQLETDPAVTAIPLGAFADPGFAPGPAYSVYENRKHGWVAILGDEVEHD
ncbi:MAG: GFA family protein [Phenylobacterium sp.]